MLYSNEDIFSVVTVLTVLKSSLDLAASSGSNNLNLNIVVFGIKLGAYILLSLVLTSGAGNLGVCGLGAGSRNELLLEIVLKSRNVVLLGLIAAKCALTICSSAVLTISSAVEVLYVSAGAVLVGVLERIKHYNTLRIADLSKLTALGAAVKLITVRSTSSSLAYSGLGIGEVMSPSLLDDESILGGLYLVCIKVSAASTDVVSSHSVVLAISLGCRNVSKICIKMSGSRNNYDSSLGLTAVLTSLVSLIAVYGAGRSLCINVNKVVTLVDLGSFELEDVLGLCVNVIDTANCAYCITLTILAAGRSRNVIALKHPGVTVSRVDRKNLYGLGVATVSTGVNSLACLSAGRAGNEFGTTAEVALVAKLNLLGCITYGTGLGCVSVLVAANVLVAVLVSVNLGIRPLVTLSLLGLGLGLVALGTSTLVRAVLLASKLGNGLPLTEHVLTGNEVLALGVKNRSTTCGTLVDVITGSIALGCLGSYVDEVLCALNVDVGALLIDRMLTLGLINELSGRFLSMIMYVNFCENGNNAAYAHNNGEQKSKNSFRIVLH